MSRDMQHLFGSIVTDPLEEPKKKNPNYATNVRYEFYSTIRKKIFWRDARGLVAIETPNVGNKGEAFYITIEYELQTSVDLDTRELMATMDLPENSPLRKELYQKIQSLNSSVHWQSCRKFRHTVAITAEDLDRSGGVVYLRDFDLVVGYEYLREKALHPYSQEGLIARMKQQLSFATQGVNLRFVLIDNTGRVEPVWFNNGVTTVEIRPTRDSHLADGLYVFYQYEEGEEVQHEYLALTDAKTKYYIFDTRMEAINLGKLDKIIERLKMDHEADILERKNQLALLEAEARKEKVEYERERERLKADREEEDRKRKDEQAEFEARERRFNEDHKRQMNLLGLERERIEFERSQWTERQRFEQTMRSQAQKDNTDAVKGALDILKLIVGLIGPLITAYALYKGGAAGKR